MTRRALLVGLLVSVALNCGLLGAIVGDLTLGRAGAVADGAAQRLTENLPPDVRPAVREALRARRFELLRAVRDFRKAKDRMRNLAAERPVDPKALSAALASMREATGRAQTIVHQAIIDGLTKSLSQ